ncbi:MAG: isoprenylcysteine carboxylmethyltransferase family protein [Alphaproteobacteria bacterium]|nr:isoprenylcysteine carboxylmethyltransferase family protein [Alphaproteobacteria bacterium]
MALIQELEVQGNWLFRRRGTLPYVMLPLLASAMIFNHPSGLLFSETMEHLWLGFSAAVSATGIIIRALVIGYVPSTTSGRNTKSQVASRVNQYGLYSIVRHPLYLGNFLVAFGLALLTARYWFILVFCLLYALYYERIMMAEEAFLHEKFGEEYDAWACRTPAFIPAFLKWKNYDMKFSWKIVLRREYPGLLVVVSGFLLLNWTQEFLLDRQPIDITVKYFFITTLVVVLLLRFLKKKTNVLDTPGR